MVSKLALIATGLVILFTLTGGAFGLIMVDPDNPDDVSIYSIFGAALSVFLLPIVPVVAALALRQDRGTARVAAAVAQGGTTAACGIMAALRTIPLQDLGTITFHSWLATISLSLGFAGAFAVIAMGLAHALQPIAARIHIAPTPLPALPPLGRRLRSSASKCGARRRTCTSSSWSSTP